MTKKTQLNVHLGVAITLTLSGIALLFAGFWVKPLGEIHNSVLIGFGEISTFAGGLFGIDYKYRYNQYESKKDKSKEPLTPDYPND